MQNRKNWCQQGGNTGYTVLQHIFPRTLQGSFSPTDERVFSHTSETFSRAWVSVEPPPPPRKKAFSPQPRRFPMKTFSHVLGHFPRSCRETLSQQTRQFLKWPLSFPHYVRLFPAISHNKRHLSMANKNFFPAMYPRPREPRE